VAGEEGGPPAAQERAVPSVFAVRTTAREERAVADGIRARAQVERADIRSVTVPKAARGIVLVEAPDFARLTNLVASVGHSRGVLSPKGEGERGRGAALGPSKVQALLEGDAPVEDFEDWLFAPEMAEEGAGDPGAAEEGEEGASEPAPKRRKGAKAAPEKLAREAKGGELPAVTARTARWLNLAMAVPVLILVLGLLAAPRVFWDEFLYPYFWQSIEADASNAGGSAEAYNAVNTLAYALILVPAIVLIYRVLERLKVRVDTRFVLMLTPFLVLGGAARALEDAQYFSKPLSYAFISPLIYIAEGLFVLALVVASWWVVRARASGGLGRGVAAWTAAFLPGAAALALFHLSPSGGLAAPIPAPILIAAIACAYLVGLVLLQRPKAAGLHGFVGNAGALLLGLSAFLIARWILAGGWGAQQGAQAATHAGEVPVIVGMAALATLITASALFLLASRFPRLANMLTPLTVLLFFAQYLDGAATYWGVDHFGYQEKHVLPGFLMSLTGTAAVMFPLKAGFVLLVSYLTDVWFRADLYDKGGEISSFGGLLKLTVIALGMGPGTRDMLRLAMGV
jgi:uncharacterized membrane protein